MLKSRYIHISGDTISDDLSSCLDTITYVLIRNLRKILDWISISSEHRNNFQIWDACVRADTSVYWYFTLLYDVH